RRVRRALKHHVLEKMSEAAAAARLEAKSNLVVDAHGHHGRCCIRRDDHFQSVRQRRALDRNMQLLHARPPVAFTFVFLFTAAFSNSASIAAESGARTTAAKRFTAS